MERFYCIPLSIRVTSRVLACSLYGSVVQGWFYLYSYEYRLGFNLHDVGIEKRRMDTAEQFTKVSSKQLQMSRTMSISVETFMPIPQSISTLIPSLTTWPPRSFIHQVCPHRELRPCRHVITRMQQTPMLEDENPSHLWVHIESFLHAKIVECRCPAFEVAVG